MLEWAIKVSFLTRQDIRESIRNTQTSDRTTITRTTDPIGIRIYSKVWYNYP